MDIGLPTTQFYLFLTASLALLLTPGPAVLYIVARSMDQGRKAGLVSVLAIETGNFGHALAAALGLSAIVVSSALAFDVVKYLGAAYLIYLGIRTLMTKETTYETQSMERRSLGKIYSQGVLVGILNPKTALFFFAFLPQFVDPARGSIGLQMLLLGVIFVTLGTITDGMYALLSGTLARWLKGNQRYLRVQRYVSGTVYIGLGVTAALASKPPAAR